MNDLRPNGIWFGDVTCFFSLSCVHESCFGIRLAKAEAMSRLLIVEDNRDYARALAESVQNKFSVVLATSLAEAMGVTTHIDVALVDVRLDEQDPANRDGLRFLEWLRTSRPSVKVVMMSAYKEFDLAVDSLNLGASYFLRKPIKLAELNDVLLKLGGSTPS